MSGPTNHPESFYIYDGVTEALDGATDDEFQVIVRDNLTTLTEFTIQLHGHIVEI